MVVRDADGAEIGIVPVGSGFALSHRHSVAQSTWRDRLRPGRDGAMVLWRTEFRDLGAGLPSGDEGGTVRLEEGWVVIEELSRTIGRLVLSPSAFTEHRLEVGRRSWDLWELAAGRLPLSLAIERVPLASLGWRLAAAARRMAAARAPAAERIAS